MDGPVGEATPSEGPDGPAETDGPVGGGGSHRRRVLRLVALVLALLLPAAVLLGMLTARTGADLGRAGTVEAAAEQVRATGGLLVGLLAGPAGRPDGAAVDRAVAELDGRTAAGSGAPGIAPRWADLRERVAVGGPAAEGAAARFSSAAADVVLPSGSPDGTAALLDLAGTQLPDLLVASGDLVRAVAAAGDDPEAAGPLGAQVAARLRLAALADEADRLLLDVAAGDVEPELLARTDDYRAALAALVPPAAFAAAAAPTGDLPRVAAQHAELVRTGAELQRAVLVALTERMAGTRSALVLEQVLTAGAGTAALVVAGWVLWTGLGRRRDPEQVTPSDGPAPDVVLVDARSLLGGDGAEFERIGRALRRRREPERDPA